MIESSAITPQVVIAFLLLLMNHLTSGTGMKYNVTNLDDKNITIIADDHLNAFVTLETLYVGQNPLLNYIPDVSSPSNSLRELFIDGNQLTTLHQLNKLGKSIETLQLSWNPIHSITGQQLA